MQNKILFTARVLAGKDNADHIERLVRHYAGHEPSAKHYHDRGVMGVKTGKGWERDLGAGIAKFERLVANFEGDRAKAVAAYVTSEAQVRGAGPEWLTLLPEDLR